MRGLIAGLVALLGAVAVQPAGAAEDFNVGFVVPLTGPQAWVGQDALDGFLLGMKHIGGRPANVQVEVFSADEGKTAEAVRAQAASMLTTEKVRMLVAATPEAMEALVEPAAAANTYLIAAGPAPAQMLGRHCSPSFFALGGYADGTHEAMGRNLQQQGMKRIALIAPDTKRARDAVAAFRRGYTGPVVVEEYVRAGRMNFRDSLQGIARAEPDGLYSLLTGGMAAAFARQYADAGLKETVPYHAPSYALDQPSIGALGEIGIDFESAGTWSENLDNPVNKRLVDDFRANYGRWPTAYAVWGYEVAGMLDTALKQVQGKHGDRETFRLALRRSEFPSPRGVTKFQMNHAPNEAYYLRAVARNDRGKATNVIRSTILPAYRPAYAGECPMRWDPTIPTPPAKR